MLIIRLIRTGKKNSSSFRIVLTLKTAGPKSGKFLEILGSYNPSLPKEIKIKAERIKYWLSQGVQTSEAVHNLLVSQGIIKGPKIKKKISPKKKSQSAEKTEEESKEKQESPAENEEVKEEKKNEQNSPESPQEEAKENLDNSEKK
jgi:small subunit ribosomal protein S16